MYPFETAGHIARSHTAWAKRMNGLHMVHMAGQAGNRYTGIVSRKADESKTSFTVPEILICLCFSGSIGANEAEGALRTLAHCTT